MNQPAGDADVPLLRLADGGVAPDPRPALVARLGDPPIVTVAQIAAVPVLLSAAYRARLNELNRLLDTALRGIVARYFDDSRIRAIYALPEAMEALLCLAKDRPYRLGCTRPDFVYDLAGHPRLCEIGARYPLNGWMLSAQAAEAYASCHTGDATPGMFLDDLCAAYRPGDTVAMVHAREAGTEIFLFGEALRARGVGFVQAHPSILNVADGRLCAGGEAVDHVILEMDRTEIPLIPAEALRHLIESGAYFNDIRTLILVHDKRMLAVLWDEAIMADILPPEDLAALRAFLIPSWTIDSPQACEAMLARDEDMIAKRSSGGRGVDALVRSDCGEGAWRMRVCAEWADDMYQLYLPQRGFSAPGEAHPIHLVGMLLCRDGTSYGAGVFRGSDAKIINVHGARGHVYVPLVSA